YPHIDLTWGIAAAFSSKGALLRRIHGGNPDCPFDQPGEDCAVVRGLIDVMARWTATGTCRPLPRPLLTHDARCFDAEHLREAVSWALRPCPGGPPLMTEGRHGGLRIHPDARDLI